MKKRECLRDIILASKRALCSFEAIDRTELDDVTIAIVDDAIKHLTSTIDRCRNEIKRMRSHSASHLLKPSDLRIRAIFTDS